MLGLIAGILFVVLGATVVIPMVGAFGVIWTLFAVAITLYHAFNVVSSRGISLYEVDLDTGEAGGKASEDFDLKLRKLAKLKEDGLITDEEFAAKRAEVMQERW
jgi:hypothetical protein